MRGGDDIEDDVPNHQDAYNCHPENEYVVAEVGLGLQPPDFAANDQHGGAQVHHAPGHRHNAAPVPDAPPKRGTGAWLHAHRSEPIYPGSTISILQAAYWHHEE